MHSSALLASLLAVAASATNIITLKSLDSASRTVYFTANAGIQSPDAVTVAGGSSVDVELVDGFIGNLYAVKEGAQNLPGMLAEVNFQAWNGLTYFDVSAIVDSTDTDNVSEMFPYEEPNTPVSGCSPFPCNNAYYLPDDIQTKSTEQTHLIVTLGHASSSSSKRDEQEHRNLPRNLVLEHYN